MISLELRKKILQQDTYTPRQIKKEGFITNTQQVANYDFILRLVKRGFLKGKDMNPAGKSPRYIISSSSLLSYLENQGL